LVRCTKKNLATPSGTRRKRASQLFRGNFLFLSPAKLFRRRRQGDQRISRNIRVRCTPKPFLVKIDEKKTFSVKYVRSPKIWATTIAIKLLAKENNRPSCENSSNLVTLFIICCISSDNGDADGSQNFCSKVEIFFNFEMFY
jgi:hypothetical protein